MEASYSCGAAATKLLLVVPWFWQYLRHQGVQYNCINQTVLLFSCSILYSRRIQVPNLLFLNDDDDVTWRKVQSIFGLSIIQPNIVVSAKESKVEVWILMSGGELPFPIGPWVMSFRKRTVRETPTVISLIAVRLLLLCVVGFLRENGMLVACPSWRQSLAVVVEYSTFYFIQHCSMASCGRAPSNYTFWLLNFAHLIGWNESWITMDSGWFVSIRVAGSSFWHFVLGFHGEVWRRLCSGGPTSSFSVC